jgi:hypothetical protein
MQLALQGDDNLGGIQDRYAVDDDVDLIHAVMETSVTMLLSCGNSAVFLLRITFVNSSY